MYIHERADWPAFTWDRAGLADLLAEVRHQQGRLLGRMESLGFTLREEATLQTLTQDVVKSSEIEGEHLDTEQVRSSIARRLGIDIGGLTPSNRHVDGIVEILLDATRHYERPLTAERLFAWHAALFPTGRSGLTTIVVGRWRPESSGTMQVISGGFGREKVHFGAPRPDRLEKEMQQFLTWFASEEAIDPVVKAALAHFWFVTIHPFDDGNGRIARAITDLLLARSEQSVQRFYSISAQIQRERKTYYDVLERCQKGTLDITPWIAWFLGCMRQAMTASDQTLSAALVKARFWEAQRQATFNPRQQLLLNRLLDGFEGKLTSSKWAKIAHTSQDTAQRDINDLLARHILVKDSAGGRSTSYRLVSPD